MATAQPALLPAGRPGLLQIPSPQAKQVEIRFAPVADRDIFDPTAWPWQPMTPSAGAPGWWEVDIDALNLAAGVYEYEYVVDGAAVADPFSEEITRFGGYRALLHIENGVAVRPDFRWTDELTAGLGLANNNAMVIYEMPLRWMESGTELDRQVDLGTFDQTIFEHLDNLAALGVNAIELLPIEDSPDTLNWGYGTRFFFAPDYDMGTPIDARCFIKACHQRGIRVLLDVVMNHAAQKCPLIAMDKDEYFVDSQDGRNGWGGVLFRYDDRNDAREFQCRMAEYWIREYHVDGFRIDEFKSIKNWDFVQMFRERAWAEHNRLFPARPFTVIAEDSERRFQATRDGADNPNGRKVVDAIWNFGYRDEARRLLTNQIVTQWGQPSRSDRIRMLIGGGASWDSFGAGSVREGYADMSQAVDYVVSHDVADAPRMMNEILGALLRLRGLGAGDVAQIRDILANPAAQSAAVQQAHSEALDRCRSAFCLVLTSVGMPMFLAGEEFGDVHDLNPWESSKMSDPVDWERLNIPGHLDLWNHVQSLIGLRTAHPALQRNEVDFFYFHPDMDQNQGVRVFAYARTAGRPLGSSGQVIACANCGSDDFAEFRFPWPWGTQQVIEIGQPRSGSAPRVDAAAQALTLSLRPFQIRVLRT